MPMEVQSFTCPRCRKGEFRSLPGPNGKAFCPWCGDAVASGAPKPDPGPLPEFSLEELANRIAGQIAAPPAAPTAPAAPASPDLAARLAESERRRDAAEAELRKELEKKQEIKKAVLAEVNRLEAELADARNRIRRKDEEHAAALQSLDVLRDAKLQEFNGDRLRYQDAVDQKDKALRALEARLEERQKAAAEAQSVLDASRATVGKLHAQIAAVEAERDDLRKKLEAAEAKVQSVKDAPAQVQSLKRQLQDAQTAAAGLKAELDKKDQRVKELQLLVKTLGERLNELADRSGGRSGGRA